MKKYPPIKVDDRFERLVVVSIYRDPRTRRIVCECLCDCGNKATPLATSLNTGNSRSCGCLGREKALRASIRHGMKRTRIYTLWLTMNQRCTNPNHEQWKNYGGRGITVCKEWRESFAAFYADMGDPPPGMSIDRRRNNEGYSKANCHWATPAQQSRNTSRNRMIEFRGRTQCLKDWSKELEIPITTLFGRLQRGWSIERTFTEPPVNPRKKPQASLSL
jgi:hypothetical protein